MDFLFRLSSYIYIYESSPIKKVAPLSIDEDLNEDNVKRKSIFFAVLLNILIDKPLFLGWPVDYYIKVRL